VIPEAAEEEPEARGEEQVREDRPDDRGAHHVEVTGAQRDERDDQFWRVAERGVEQAADCVAGSRRELLG
jgi:hypothetical protein